MWDYGQTSPRAGQCAPHNPPTASFSLHFGDMSQRLVLLKLTIPPQAPSKEAPTLSWGSEFYIPLLREGGGGGAQSTDPTDGFYLQPLRLVCARLLTYFEELRAPLAQGWPPTRTP